MSLLKSTLINLFLLSIVFVWESYGFEFKPNLKNHSVNKFNSQSSLLTNRDTIRILAIRIDFPSDTLSTTTGNGSFDYGTRDGRLIDPPPHDSIYFQHQFQFLNHYFSTVSKGKTVIQADVFPHGIRNAYRAPEPIWHYHPNPSDTALTNLRITQLWYQAWRLAEQDTNIHFLSNGQPNYDVFLVIHAGSGNEYDLGYDETPFDIPSGFITPSDLSYYLNLSNPNGISVRNGQYYIREGALLPEMSSQKVGERWVDIGIGGLYALLIGRSIGMPFLYDTKTGQSRLGRWEFMDRGFGTFFGILPAYPSAYTRIKMGWSNYVSAPDTGTLSLRVVNADTINLPEIYRVNGTGTEYFLIEARNRDPDSLDFSYVYDANNRRAKLTNRYEIEIEPSDIDSFGVIVRADNYEFDIPGSGVLIWRINASEERSRLVRGQPLQSGEPPYAVTLIEADGANDIGQNYGFFHPGSGTESGSPHDAYYRLNPDWRYANNGDNSIRFTPFVKPPAVMSNGSPAPFELRNFSNPSRVIHFRISSSQRIAGETRLRIPPSEKDIISLPIDTNFDNRDELWIADSTRIYCISDSGSWYGSLLDVYSYQDSHTGITLDRIQSYIVTQVTGEAVETFIYSRDNFNNSFLLTISPISSTNQSKLTSLKLNWLNQRVFIDSLFTVTLPTKVIRSFSTEQSTWKIFLEGYEPIDIPLRLNQIPELQTRSSYIPIIHWDDTYSFFITENQNLPIQSMSTGLGDYVVVDSKLHKKVEDDWIAHSSFHTSDSVRLLTSTSENLGIMSDNFWWLWGNNSVRTDYPKRLLSDSSPTAIVSSTLSNGKPLIWYGTESGELWNINPSYNDNRYPISVGSRSVSSISILSDSSNSQHQFRIAAVSKDGGIYLTSLPIAEIEQVTSVCIYGRANGKPLFVPAKNWISSSPLTFDAFVWPNPIRENRAFVRLFVSSIQIEKTKIEVFDLDGKHINDLKQYSSVEGGGYEFEWDVTKLNRGIYLIRIDSQGLPVKLIRAAVL